MLLVAALMQSVYVTPAPAVVPAETGPITALDAATLDRFCGADGGLAGRFGELPDRGSADEVDTAGNPHWSLDQPIGPFNRMSVFTDNNTDRVQALRYIATTSETFDMQVLIEYLAKTAPAAGWTRRPASAGVIANLWEKSVTTESGTVTLRMTADGGLWLTSLYCRKVTHGASAAAAAKPE